MNTQTGADTQQLKIPYVSLYNCMSFLCHGSIGLVVIPFVLMLHAPIQCISLYYHRDPLDDPHQPVVQYKRINPQISKNSFLVTCLIHST